MTARLICVGKTEDSVIDETYDTLLFACKRAAELNERSTGSPLPITRLVAVTDGKRSFFSMKEVYTYIEECFFAEAVKEALERNDVGQKDIAIRAMARKLSIDL